MALSDASDELQTSTRGMLSGQTPTQEQIDAARGNALTAS